MALLPRLFLLAFLASGPALRANDCGTCCCQAETCCPADAPDRAQARPESEVRVAETTRAEAVAVLARLVAAYVADPAERAQALADLADHPERVYRHPVFELARLSPADAESYLAIGGSLRT